MTMAEAIISGNLEAVKKIQLENPSCIDELYNGITLPNLAASTGHTENILVQASMKLMMITELFSFMPSQQIMLSL